MKYITLTVISIIAALLLNSCAALYSCRTGGAIPQHQMDPPTRESTPQK